MGRSRARPSAGLPDAKRDRFTSLGLSAYDASVLVADQAVAHFYEGVLAAGAIPSRRRTGSSATCSA
ncbi:MAG: hypothetical protein U0703_00225 [Anaerolineae bacterium]